MIVNKLKTLNPINNKEINLAATISATRGIHVRSTRNNNEPSRRLRPTSHALTILLILSGDVHLNPGPGENSPSRYDLIGNIVERLSPKKAEKMSKLKTKQSETNIFLLKELTAISPKDYIGVDTCSSCFKEVKEVQQAVICDKCEKWIHRRCSDMKMKTYNENKIKRSFNWICNICRKDDRENHDKINVNILK